jgi:G:T-mismatch repair DNA endonuclease (very short patch repair protein)
MKKLCEVCESEFDVKPSRAEYRKTCSTKCSGILKTRRGRIELKCFVCQANISKSKSQIGRSKSGNVFCSNECVGTYNSENNRQNIKKECIICEKEFITVKAREEKHITCSKECHNKWQSEYRVGEKSGNFRGGGGIKQCKNCMKDFVVENKTLMQTRVYCSKACKNQYWAENILHNEKFKIAHFNGNRKYRENRAGETKPERLVREFLESRGLVKNKDFFQEAGFFRKYYADFFIPKTKTVIEVNGDYWHGNPEVYGLERGLVNLSPQQIDRIEKDKEKESDFIRFGFNYFVIWEKDIYEDLENTMSQIVNTIFPLNDYTQDALADKSVGDDIV